MQRKDSLGAGSEVDAGRGSHAVSEEALFLFAEPVLEVRVTGAGDAYASRIRVARENDKRSGESHALHIATVLAGARPRNSHRRKPGVRGDRLDPVAVAVGDASKLV